MSDLSALRRVSREVTLKQLALLFPGDWTPARDGCPTAELAEGRYATVVKSTTETTHYWVSTRADEGEAMDLLSVDLADWQPFAVLDLDTLNWTTP